MTEQNMTTEATIHPMTRKAADTSLAKRQISPDSYKAILAGELSLEEARSLGRSSGPAGPAVRVDKNDRSRPCIACGGTTQGGRFHPGCDAKMYRIAREYVRGERDLTEEQLAYVRDESDKLERAKRKVSEEDRRKAEKQAKKPKK